MSPVRSHLVCFLTGNYKYRKMVNILQNNNCSTEMLCVSYF